MFCAAAAPVRAGGALDVDTVDQVRGVGALSARAEPAIARPAPATHAAGQNNTSYPPMGLRVRLKASFDTSSFTGPTLVILTAMKQYGLILADNGSNWYVSGDSDDAWTNLMDQLVSDFEKVTGSDFEAVETGPLSTAGL